MNPTVALQGHANGSHSNVRASCKEILSDGSSVCIYCRNRFFGRYRLVFDEIVYCKSDCQKWTNDPYKKCSGNSLPVDSLKHDEIKKFIDTFFRRI